MDSMCLPQTVEKPQFCLTQNWGLNIFWTKYKDLQKVVGILPLPNCKLFQVHGSKFKPHPIRYLGQACVSCVSHAMLFLGIRKDPFNGFLAHLVVSLVSLRIAKLFCHIHIRLPDVLRYRLNEVLIPGT